MPAAVFNFDWSVIVGQGIFAVLFVYLFLDTRNESRRREELMRDSFVKREENFINHESQFIGGLHENTVALTQLTTMLTEKLGDMKEHIEANDRITARERVKRG